jgi:DNA-binding protein H-NS
VSGRGVAGAFFVLVSGVVPVLEKLENLGFSSPSIVDETADVKAAVGVHDFSSMSVDELWALREAIDTVLASKISTELEKLSEQLDRLSPSDKAAKPGSPKRAKAAARKSSRPVLPKYQNPARPFETWSGRGRRPLWIKEQLIMGKPLEDFSVA